MEEKKFITEDEIKMRTEEALNSADVLPHISLEDNRDFIGERFQGPEKEMDILTSDTLSSLKSTINHLKIRKNDIVDIIPNEGEWFLLYYKLK